MNDRHAVLDIEEPLRLIVRCLDFHSIEALLLAIASDSSCASISQDASLWIELILKHFKSRRPSRRSLSLSKQIQWAPEAHPCLALQEFLFSGSDRERFRRCVHISKERIGLIKSIDGIPVDTIVFPTSRVLGMRMNAQTNEVLCRAGAALDKFMIRTGPECIPPLGRANPIAVTPGFGAGVELLIHCAPPANDQIDLLFQFTQIHSIILELVRKHDVHCIAISPILPDTCKSFGSSWRRRLRNRSVGCSRVSLSEFAKIALRTLQASLSQHDWEGRVCFVCADNSPLFEAYQDQLNSILDDVHGFPSDLVSLLETESWQD